MKTHKIKVFEDCPESKLVSDKECGADLLFDETGGLLCYTTVNGIECLDIKTDEVVRVLGRNEQ